MLDAFCYAGAFGVMAAGTAAGVTFLDASSRLSTWQAANLAANAGCPGETLPGDALDTLASLRDGGRNSAWVCVDPRPSSSARRTPNRASNAYRGSTMGLQLVGKRGHSYELFLFAPPWAEALRA